MAAVLGLLAMAGALPAQVPPMDGEASEARPRIGLALGGGGARGGAHIGVLKVLDELRVPVDCVAGTSMGALVGATFAAGASADDVERQVSAINWAETIGGEGQRPQVPMQRKLSGITYSNNIQFSVRGGRLHGGGGFLSSQQVEAQLRLLIGEARSTADFDALPLPFRAVATDLISSRMVVLDSGDLAEAMRASMAVPGLFAPIIADDQVLTDGGMVRNLPVDVVRDLCADVVIAVSLEGPPPRAEDMRSMFTLAGRTVDAIIKANEQLQLDTLTTKDVAIIVRLDDVGSTDFDRVDETILPGAEAARQVATLLQRYALPEEDYRRWRASLDPPARAPLRINDIRFRPLRHASTDYLATRLKTRPGDVVTLAAIERDMSRVFDSGDFSRVLYHLHPGSGDGHALEIEAVEKPGGTDFLRFDLGLAGSTGGDVLFVLRADHRKEWVNARGGQWRSALQLGQLSQLETAFYQPLDVAQRYYFEPGVYLQRSLEDIFDDGNRIARYELREAQARLEAGLNIGNYARLHGSVRHGAAQFELDTGAVPLFDEDRTRDSSIVLGGLHDSRDASTLPTRGSYAQFEYTHSGGWLGGEQSYQQVEAVAGHAARWGGSVVLLAGGVGHTLSGDLPPYRDFRIGGIRSFPALERGEIRGEGYLSASATWMLKLADIQALFGQVFFGGFGLHALEVTDRIDQVDDGTILGVSFTLGARTPVGPLLISFGAANNDSVQLQLALGRPIAEGSLLDRLH